MEGNQEVAVMSSTDRIEKSVLLHAPRARVWRALTNHREFGTWFRVALDGAFREGATVRGNITYPGYQHVTMEMQIVRMDPERLFSYRWHPYAIEPAVDYSAEPTTLVEFTLADEAGGTRLTVVESGFDRLPASRRTEAFRMNDGGWSEQMTNVERHVAAG